MIVGRNMVLAGVALLGFAGASSVQAQSIVIKSSGAAAKVWTPGKPVAGNSKIVLAAGDSVTVMGNGGTRVFRGPGTFAASSQTQTAGLMSSALSKTGAKQARTGAVRGGFTMNRPASVWTIDTSKDANVCYRASDKVAIWMPWRSGQSELTITRASDGKAVPVELRPGQRFAQWPVSELPLDDGAHFTLVRTGETEAVKLKFEAVGVEADAPERTVSEMVRAGCDGQLDMLAQNTAAAPENDEDPIG